MQNVQVVRMHVTSGSGSGAIADTAPAAAASTALESDAAKSAMDPPVHSSCKSTTECVGVAPRWPLCHRAPSHGIRYLTPQAFISTKKKHEQIHAEENSCHDAM